MRFSQLFLKMGYNESVKVYKAVKYNMEDNETAVNTEYVGAFNRHDKVPRDIWSAFVCIIGADKKNALSVIAAGVEVQANDKA